MNLPRLFSAMLVAGLLASCNSGNPDSAATSETTALTDTVLAAKAVPLAECEGEDPPQTCIDDCGTTACEYALLLQHSIPNLTGYVKNGGAFPYDTLKVYSTIQGVDCSSSLLFNVFPEAGGSLGSGITIDVVSPSTAKARRFPVPLIKGIRRKYNKNVDSIYFYWMSKSPQCPNGGDVVIDVALKDNTHHYYDLSLPPDLITMEEAKALGLFDKAVPQSLPHAISR